MHIGLNRDWSFTERFDEAFLRGEGAAETVELPHTCVLGLRLSPGAPCAG